MRPASVVVFGPFRDSVARMLDAEEQCLVQQFIPHPPVEGFHETVLHGLAGCDVVPVNGMVLRPGEDRMRGELSAIVGDNHPRLAAPGDQVRQLPGHPHARDRGVGDRGQALARHVIDDVENPEATTIGHLIVNEVERPAGVDPGFDQDRGADANSSPPGSALADRQPLFAIEPVYPVDP